MDPTLQMQQNMPGMQADPNSALQNALMLAAIKGDASGGAAPSMPPTSMPPAPSMSGGAGSAPSPMPIQPVDPASMQGGLGMPQMQQAAQQQAQAAPMNPIVSALMSQNIPGGQ